MAKKTPTRRGTKGRTRASNTRSKTNNRKKAAPPRTLGSALSSFRERLKRQPDDFWGFVLIVLGIIFGLAFVGSAGPGGVRLKDGATLLFGMWGYALPFGLVALGISLVIGHHKGSTGRMIGGSSIVFLSSLGIFHLLTGSAYLAQGVEFVRERGGAVGSLIAFPLFRVLEVWGAFVVLVSILTLGILILTRSTVKEMFLAFGELLRAGKHWVVTSIRRIAPEIPQREPRPEATKSQPRHVAPKERLPRRSGEVPSGTASSTKEESKRPGRRERPARDQGERATPIPKTGELDYVLPPLDLLNLGGGGELNRRSLEQTAENLEDTLRQHGVDATLTTIVPGPTVTRFEVELAPGVKVNRVQSLAHDIAYALATPDVRMLVPIPGKSAIGIEVPNKKRRLVCLGDILRSPEAQEDERPLSVGLGMDINGAPRLIDLSELPHILIAGATGAGKSSCINSFVTSLLMRTYPDDVRLIMVDPKRVELGQYNGVPHLLTRVITNPKKANDALKWAVAEMDRRYDLLADAHVRDIIGYRLKLDAGHLDVDQFDRFPYIIVIVDELNDLMMVAGKDVEDSIVRIAQMARAVGIHLVLATQRPSVNVITGVIKANIPSRLAFSVTSQTDSRVILDSSGAEKLIGMGDMLVVTAKEPRPARIQGAWVSEEEVHAVVEWVKAQQETQYRDKEVLETAAASVSSRSGETDDEEDRLVRQAMEEVVRSQLGSTSMLQRKLRIGFARAGRVMDTLEQMGVVGPSHGSKAREVLMTADELEELLNEESSMA